MSKLTPVSLIAAILAFSFSSCKKHRDESTKPDGQIKFSISALPLKNTLESVSDSGVSTGITSVVVTIEDLEGKDIKSLEKIDLYNMNGYYISKPISLPTGGYKLTEFLVLNGKNQVVYAAPLAGSPKEGLVENPLPISFTVSKDSGTKLTPQVVSTTESKPSDFGYNTFSFEVAETFDFLVGAFVYDDSSKNFELTKANIKILNDTSIVYEGALKANQAGTAQLSNYDSLGITNKITLPERYNSYIIEINKPGYKTYRETFTKEELRLYNRKEDKGPLVIVLEKQAYDLTQGLVAYYPFDGNANDESGNMLNGVVYGAILCPDRFGVADKAYSFNGYNYSYVNLTNAFDFDSRTISLWFNVSEATNVFGVIYVSDNPTLYFGLTVLGVKEINSNIELYFNVSGEIDTEIIDKGVWYNATIVTKGFNYEYYLNGKLINNSKLINYIKSGDGNNYATLGCSRVFDRHFFGLIDDVRIYNRVLSQQEITELYNE